MIQMTQEQWQAFRKGSPVRLRDPELGEEIVVCPAAVFERMGAQLREFIEDEKEQEEWVETSMEDLARRLDEDEDV